MTINLEVAGVRYQDFVSASASIRLDALSNTFSFVASSEDARALPFRGGEACRVIVENEPVVTGFIEIVNVDGDASSHDIALQGRDKTGDLLDSSIGVLGDLSQGPTLKAIAEKVIAHIGADIDVVDLANPEPFTSSEDLAAPDQGVGAFEFLERLARKRQVLLTSNGDGDLVLTQSSGLKIDAFLLNRIGDEENNILKYSVSYDTTGRYNLYRSLSQRNLLAINNAGASTTSSVVSQGGVGSQVIDAEIRAGRQRILVAESMSSTAEGLKRMTWQASIDKARGTVYSATVDGYKNQTGNLWAVNQIVTVFDDDCGIDAPMLVSSVVFSFDEDEGRSTALGLVKSNAYSLELEEPQTEKTGLGLF